MRIVIDPRAYERVMTWVNKADFECSGLGKAQIVDDTIYVTSAYLLKQKNTSVSTDIDDVAWARFMYDSRGEPGEPNWWWHSHVRMDVNWSGTDTATIRQLASKGWVAASVFNQKNEVRSACAIGVPFHIENLDVETRVGAITSASERSAWLAEYDATVEFAVRSEKSIFVDEDRLEDYLDFRADGGGGSWESWQKKQAERFSEEHAAVQQALALRGQTDAQPSPRARAAAALGGHKSSRERIAAKTLRRSRKEKK